MDAQTLELLAGKEFNEILAGDAILKELEAAQGSSVLDQQLLLDVLQLGDYRVGNLPVRPLTVAKWSFLWMLKSPFVIGGTVDLCDWDVFLFVLSQVDLREISCSLEEITEQAGGYALATMLDADALLAEIKAVIKSAFYPMEMMPPANDSVKSDESGIYDGIWASYMAATAARESGMSFDHCLHRMSLASVFTLLVNWYRRESVEGSKIRRRTSQEIEEKIMERIDTLAQEYIKKLSQE